jgi:hypothetical protein
MFRTLLKHLHGRGRPIDWAQQRVSIDVSRSSVQGQPPYEFTNEINRQREAVLYEHHGKLGYWEESELVEDRL